MYICRLWFSWWEHESSVNALNTLPWPLPLPPLQYSCSAHQQFWLSHFQITESDHESDSDFVLNKSDEESSSTADDDVNVSIDSSEEDHVVDVPGENLPDIPNPLLMPIHPCMNAILRAL